MLGVCDRQLKDLQKRACTRPKSVYVPRLIQEADQGWKRLISKAEIAKKSGVCPLQFKV